MDLPPEIRLMVYERLPGTTKLPCGNEHASVVYLVFTVVQLPLDY
jgi:hypothetical protein